MCCNGGVAGAALSSLFSRGVAAVVITVLLFHPEHVVSLRTGAPFRPDGRLIRRILQIGVPNGLENSLFQLGRILVVSIIALFGTTQIAANAVANNLDAVAVIPGQAMSPRHDHGRRPVHRRGRYPCRRGSWQKS